MRTRLGLLTAMMFVLLFSACGGGSSGGGTPLGDDTSDAPDPVETVISLKADAGKDQNVLTSSSVALYGGDSLASVNSNDEMTYYWEFTEIPSGSAASLSDETTAIPRFTVDRDGDYLIRLTTGQGQESSTDSVMITASTENLAPTADAGADQNVNIATEIILDGSDSLDANGDELTYSWSLVAKVTGSTVSLPNTTIVNPIFRADKDGTYLLELIVNDGKLDSLADRVSIIVSSSNSSPVADAGSDQNVNKGTEVTLDGSGSSDADSDNITYAWSFVSKAAGSVARFSNPTSVQPIFTADEAGTYILQLIVDDGTVNSTSDRVNVIATVENAIPQADAGIDQNVNVGHNVILDGSKSSDANSDRLTYKWTLVSSPDDIDVLLSSTITIRPAFSADREGTYVLRLVVNDGKADSSADSVTIIANTANSAPVIDSLIVDSSMTAPFYVGQIITLRASASDADNDPMTYLWSYQTRPDESTGLILNSWGRTAKANFLPDAAGDYVIEVKAYDGLAISNTEKYAFSIGSHRNQRPVANAGPDINRYVGNDQYIYGYDSYDPDGDELTYRWTLISSALEGQDLSPLLDGAAGPPGSTYITIGAAGDYVIELIVNDGLLDSLPDRMTVTQTISSY